MPAAAVIPALKAYTRVVAVKKLVVGGETLRKIECLRVKWESMGRPGHNRDIVRKRIETIEDISIL